MSHIHPLVHSALRTWSRVLFSNSQIFIFDVSKYTFRCDISSLHSILLIFIYFNQYFVRWNKLVRAQIHVFDQRSYRNEHKIDYNSFWGQLFSEFFLFFLKYPLVRSLLCLEGVRKVVPKKSYITFAVSQGWGGGESSSSKCPRPAQVDFNSDFRVVGSNPGTEFPKNFPYS